MEKVPVARRPTSVAALTLSCTLLAASPSAPSVAMEMTPPAISMSPVKSLAALPSTSVPTPARAAVCAAAVTDEW